MRATIDQVYSAVISKSCRIKDSDERADFQQLARQAYINDDMRKLKQYDRIVSSLPECAMPTPYVQPKQIPPPKKLAPGFEASGMPDPSRYHYFSNYNSPLNQQQPKTQIPYPLYANFGAYNKSA